MLKPLTVWIQQLWRILKEMGIPDPLICLLWNLHAGKEATVRTGHRTTNWFKLGKEYVKAGYCHSGYLTYIQSVVQPLSCVWLFVIQWTAGFSISHYLLEFAQIHVCWVGDTIQPPQPLLLSSSFAFNLSQHQGLWSQWVGFSSQVAKRLEFWLQHQSFQWIFRVDFI